MVPLSVLLGTRKRPTCWICGYAVARDPKKYVKGLRPTRDHVEPLSNGGARGSHNIKLAHHFCNSNRGSDPVTPEMRREFRARIRSLINQNVPQYRRRYFLCKPLGKRGGLRKSGS